MLRLILLKLMFSAGFGVHIRDYFELSVDTAVYIHYIIKMSITLPGLRNGVTLYIPGTKTSHLTPHLSMENPTWKIRWKNKYDGNKIKPLAI